MPPTTSFLSGVQLRPVTLPADSPYQPIGLALGSGTPALEVLIVAAPSPPRAAQVRGAWRARHGGRPAPLLLVVLHGGSAALCGPAGDEPTIFEKVDLGQAERLAREALAQPDRHAALRLLRDALPSVKTRLPGLRNEGFLATHELEVGVRSHRAWIVADAKARPALKQRGEPLLEALGFRIERADQNTSILRTTAAARKVAVAVLLNQAESPELVTDRFNGLSPVSYALTVAERERLPYVVVLQGTKVRLYPVEIGVGVGRRGRTETYLEIHTGLLRDADAAYLWLLFSAEALDEGGTLAELLAESKRFAGNLAENLRDRIYNFVVPPLATGLAKARGFRKPTPADLAVTYEMAMTVLFRLLFIAYGEDKDLLPYKWNSLYQGRSLKHKAQELLELVCQSPPLPLGEGRGEGRPERGPRRATDCLNPGVLEPLFDDSDSLWEEIARLFVAVAEGHREWGIPSYDGGLFSADPEVSRAGELLADIRLPNKVVGPVLANLLLIGTPEGIGPVDFRSLGVREFGTIYEGLLESELAVAETDLAVDDNGFYRPCREGEEAVVTRRHIYLHNRSGARKATGAYFTKQFAVEHLLQQALEPALDAHFARLDRVDADEAARQLFDFRVADIAMGSGHFLVAAVDHIERAMSQYLARRSLPGVRQELAQLHAAARQALGALADAAEIEDTQLVRRLIARRCLYGVDLNPVSVQLARLSIWIHTFVPGLPLSLLDHNLVCGNSLVGVGRVEEIVELAAEDDRPMFRLDATTLVGAALEPLTRLARIADATRADLRKARKAYDDARKAVRPAEALCDIATACRMSGEALPIDLEQWGEEQATIVDSRPHRAAVKALAGLRVLHFPVAFPEVFLRERRGFDVILGNPPWEEAKAEEDEFWSRHEPGFKSLSLRDRTSLKMQLRRARGDLVQLFDAEVASCNVLRNALIAGPYPGIGTGDPDAYKAFAWRFWQLASNDGWIGVVLPRSAWSAKGSTQYRVEVFSSAKSVALDTLLNTKGWVFPEAEARYTIVLVSIHRGGGNTRVRLRGPFASLEQFKLGVTRRPAIFEGSEVANWTDTSSLPLLPTFESVAIFKVLRQSPRLDLNDGLSWRARPLSEEVHSRKEQHLMRAGEAEQGDWPVYKGESFDIWSPDTHVYYGWAEPKQAMDYLNSKRLGGSRKNNSPFFEFRSQPGFFGSPTTLACMRPRVLIRRVSNRTNQRTIVAALAPSKVFVADQACCLLWPRGDNGDVAYLLGILSSIPLDWYARRFVEVDVRLHVINPLPIPRPARDNPLWQRVVQLAGRLAAVDERYDDWARAVGVEVGPLEADEKFDMISELDAVVAHLYGLDERHLAHIFETFHEAWRPGTVADHPTLGDYDRRLAATLHHYRAWASQGGRAS